VGKQGDYLREGIGFVPTVVPEGKVQEGNRIKGTGTGQCGGGISNNFSRKGGMSK